MRKSKTLISLCLTSLLLRSSTQHLVEDVECSLIFGLAGGTGLFQEVWVQTVMDLHDKTGAYYHVFLLHVQ